MSSGVTNGGGRGGGELPPGATGEEAQNSLASPSLKPLLAHLSNFVMLTFVVVMPLACLTT